VKGWNRASTWLGLAVICGCLVLAVVLGTWTYMASTAVPVHPAAETVPSTVASATVPPRWIAAVADARSVVRAHLSERNVPGLSVAVGVDGGLVWAEGFGWADIEQRVAVTPDTQFAIGTASMVLTSAAVGLLLDRRRLTLDDDIRTYVPASPTTRWPVSMRHLMSHTAGVRTDSGDEGPLLSTRCASPFDALPQFAAQSLLFEPGSEYRFSSYGWILVSAAIEAVAREPFLRFMRKQVFEPVGMHDTRADDAGALPHDRATTYFPRFAADPRYGLDLMRDVDHSCYAGAAVFQSTPSDLVRFGLAMQRGTLVQDATVALLQTPQRLTSGQDTGYGLGWDLETVTLAGRDTRAVGHDGDVLGGMVASVAAFPEHGLVVAVAANLAYADTVSLQRRVAEAFANRALARQR
jgi:serine beta-lactamase-like protein LACTB